MVNTRAVEDLLKARIFLEDEQAEYQRALKRGVSMSAVKRREYTYIRAYNLDTRTWQWPAEQRFRMGEYAVTAADGEVAREVEELRSWEPPDYDTLYAKRRVWMQLVPDASEMYAYVLLDEDAADSEASIPELRLPKQ